MSCPASKYINRVPFFLLALLHVSSYERADQILCGVTFECSCAKTDRFDNMRVTAGGLRKVQMAPKDVCVPIAHFVDGRGIVGFNADQNLRDLRMTKRSQDGIGIQAFHTQAASHRVRCDTKAALFTNL